MLTILGSAMDIIMDLYDHFVGTSIFTLIVNKLFIQGKWLKTRFGVANHMALIVCFTSYNKRVQRENMHLFYFLKIVLGQSMTHGHS